MSEDTPADNCAICVAAIAQQHVEFHWKDAEGAHFEPVGSFELAVAWMGKGRRLVHRQWKRELLLYSVCVVGGTPVCEAHSPYALHLWSKGL